MTQAEQDEISLADIFTIIKRYRRMILAAPVICGVAAFILVTFVMPPQWEASTIIQVGQIDQIGQGVKIEPIANIIARMRHPSFADEVLKQADFKQDERLTAEFIHEGLLKSTKKIKEADLIEFKLRGYTPDMAKTLAMNTVSYLQKIHDEMIDVNTTRIKAQIQITTEEMQTLKSEMNALEKQLSGKRDWNSYDATLAATVLQNKSNRLREAVQRKQSLIDQLNPSVTFTTKIFGGVTVSKDPVAPKKLLIIGMAILIGLLGGLFVAFVRNVLSGDKTPD